MVKYKRILKKIILGLTPKRIKTLIINNTLQAQNIDISNIHFSQEGEDIILDKFFYEKQKGFYVDIGAHHPMRLSNTYKYYLKGWKGINVDAMPGSMDLFKQVRSRDVNLEIGVGQSKGVLPFYVFEQGTLNTFDVDNAKRLQESGIKLKSMVNVPVMPLSVLLDKYLPAGQHIDFMSVDVEGLDYEVLCSNDWTKYKPTVLIVESIDAAIDQVLTSQIHKMLVTKGYTYISKTFHSNIYKLN
jgi:FkbM family methyltransferase